MSVFCKFPAASCKLLIFLSFYSAIAQQSPPFINAQSKQWADSVFATMSYEQKIGQLFMPEAYSNRDSAHIAYLDSLIKHYHLGGIIFFQGGPKRHVELVNRYQSQSKIPLLISIDGEWGLSMRLDSTIRFPRQMTLAAMNNDSLIYEMGKEIARQCKRTGIHINFAPVVDINNNPLNPIINSRSFGEEKNEVARKGLMYMKGMQDNHVIACAKHFPGHGNTDTDSHFALPIINQSKAEMDSMELYPFKVLFQNGLGSVMVAHLFIPSYDTTTNQPSTLSSNIIKNLLQDEMKFEGLIFTDALDMKGVSNYYAAGDIELNALKAGNDMLLKSIDVPSAWWRIHYAIQNCEIEQEQIDSHVKKILMAKHFAGLQSFVPVDTTNLYADLVNENVQWLNADMYSKAITVLKNDAVLPLTKHKKIASLVVNDTLNNPFQQMISNYALADYFSVMKDFSEDTLKLLVKSLSEYDHVIVSIHNTSTRSNLQFGISDQTDKLIELLAGKTKLVLCVLGNSYCFTRLPHAQEASAVILGYEDAFLPQQFIPQIIFGGRNAAGRIPVTPVKEISRNTGLILENNLRLKHTLPQELNLSFEKLSGIDRICRRAIEQKATPGCQVLVALDNKIIYQKSFGHHTPHLLTPSPKERVDSLLHSIDELQPKVTNSNLYDIASVTKIAATALAAMKLFDDGKIDITKKVSRYLPELRRTNKADLIIKDVMAHRAGLPSWIPFYKETLLEGKPSAAFYRDSLSDEFNIKVCDSLYLRSDYPEIIWNKIKEAPLEKQGQYVYSDIGMIILQKMIEKITKNPLDEYVEEKFFNPLGLYRITFHPLEKFTADKIIPSEDDSLFRHCVVHGYVHDPAAAMMGGVAGHAGLFSDAGSLAVIMQMLLNGGEYGGMRYLNKETVDLFTSQQFTGNRRGLIFDRPLEDKTKNGPTAKSASQKTFGHTGFTGTCAWADPENKLVYIFLSNRTFPSSVNSKLAEMNVRTDVMEEVYSTLRGN